MEILFLWLLHFRIFPWLKLSPSKLVTELQCVEISSIASILRFFRRKKMLLDIKPCPGKCNLEKNMSIRELRRKSVATLLVHRTLWSMASLLITPLEIQTNTTHTWKQDPFLTEIGKKKAWGSIRTWKFSVHLRELRDFLVNLEIFQFHITRAFL